MTFRKISGKLHLWLGLAAGLVVMVSMLAASVFVWDKELTDWYHRDKVFVESQQGTRLPMDTLIQRAKAASRYDNVSYLRVEPDPSRAFQFTNYRKSGVAGWTYASTLGEYSRIYVDQYSGKVLGVVDLRYDWIFSLRMLHQCLLLNYELGHYVVGFATLIILVMVITGIVLWWPRNKAALKQRMWFRWKSTTKWKRKNYDLHNIGGVYTLLFILVFAVTGLVWTFDWWTNGIYRLLGNDPEKVWSTPGEPEPVETAIPGVYDKILDDATRRVRGWTEVGISIQPDTASVLTPVNAFVRYSSGNSGWDESDSYSYHPRTGEMYFSTPHAEKTTGAKWRNSNYAIHVGSIYGLPTKILASFVALFCASLPVSGFLIWLGGSRKKSARKNAVPGRPPANRAALNKVAGH